MGNHASGSLAVTQDVYHESYRCWLNHTLKKYSGFKSLTELPYFDFIANQGFHRSLSAISFSNLQLLRNTSLNHHIDHYGVSSLGYLLYFLRKMWGCMCWILGDREDIFITCLFIMLKSEVSTFPIVIVFSVVVCLRWLYHHKRSVSHTHTYTYTRTHSVCVAHTHIRKAGGFVFN